MLPSSLSYLHVCKNCIGGACRARVTTKLSQKFPDPKEAERFYIECEAEIQHAGSKSPLVDSKSSSSSELPSASSLLSIASASERFLTQSSLCLHTSKFIS